ncbi:transcriptional repressor LexA [Candidatus Microgenomates bacterium]|nr:transcriptional repressor LexA [Candidatus Microgenomates bacterium]
MPVTIYRRQEQILGFLKQFINAHGSAPTLSQIAQALGVSSLATVHEHLATLERKGLIKRNNSHNHTRSIELTNGFTADHEHEFSLPILGYIAAGAPIEPFTDPNATIGVAPWLISGIKRSFVLQVRGESMIGDGIYDGDYVVVEQQETANNGDIVVALLDNGMATLKRYYKEATRIRLEPANARMSPIFARNVKVQGKVVGLVRKYQT